MADPQRSETNDEVPEEARPQLDKRGVLSMPGWRLLIWIVVAFAVLWLLEQLGALG